MKTDDMLACQISTWYPIFKNVTFKSKFITLPEDVVKYLLEDGMVLPSECSYPEMAVNKSDSDDDESDWNDADDGTNTVEGPSFPDFTDQIKRTIKCLGGEVFPKLNWSCPKDAAWISSNKTLRCTCPTDIFLLLKSSDFVTHDLTEPFQCCQDTHSKADLQYQLALRRWHILNSAGEFRCFVKNRILFGISQRHHREYYKTIVENRDELLADITEFFRNNIKEQFPLVDYVFDVYVKEKAKVYLVDFNAFAPVTDSLLYDWEELESESPVGLDLKNGANPVPDFRIIESKGHVQTSTYESYAIPQDFVHLSSGLDPDKLMDFLQLQTQNGGESSSDEEKGESETESTQCSAPSPS